MRWVRCLWDLGRGRTRDGSFFLLGLRVDRPSRTERRSIRFGPTAMEAAAFAEAESGTECQSD